MRFVRFLLIVFLLALLGTLGLEVAKYVGDHSHCIELQPLPEDSPVHQIPREVQS